MPESPVVFYEVKQVDPQDQMTSLKPFQQQLKPLPPVYEPGVPWSAKLLHSLSAPELRRLIAVHGLEQLNAAAAKCREKNPPIRMKEHKMVQIKSLPPTFNGKDWSKQLLTSMNAATLHKLLQEYGEEQLNAAVAKNAAKGIR